jgi:nucleoid-associated protein YgaU
MRKHLFVLGGLLLSSTAFAQYPAEFTKDQADSTIALRRTEITSLQNEVNTTNSNAAKAAADAAQTLADNTKCQESLYAMLGSTRAGYNSYREQLQRDEQELSMLRGMSATQLGENKARMDALEAQIRELRGNKLALIPDHYRRVGTLSSSYITMKRGMVPANTVYTVGTWRKDRDCLWNIAKKPEIYNDPFAWPKIWRANMDQIRNPDVIHPGQQLSIAKTEVTEADKDLTGYRHRRK